MCRLSKTLIACLLLAMLWPVAARAVELTGFDSLDETKKLTLTFTFSEVVDAQIIHHYAGNYVEISIEDLKLARKYTRKDHTPADAATGRFYNSTNFQAVNGEGHIRVQLGKYADPSDVQVVELDEKIVVDLVKPYYKLPQEEPVAVEPEPVPAEVETTEFIPDSPEAEVPAEEPTDATAGEFTEPYSPPAGLRSDSTVTMTEIPAPDTQPEQVVVEDAAGSAGEYATTSLDDLRHEAAVPTVGNSAAGQPVRDFQPGPSYKVFDLDDVPVAQLQLRNMAFNEALMELTAGSGFNVVVGAGVSNELMTLDFRQKELSLKRALDLLCMAYDLAYVVEDDAIVIKGK